MRNDTKIEFRCLKDGRDTTGSSYKLYMRVMGEGYPLKSFLIATGLEAHAILKLIESKWHDDPNAGYFIRVQPYDCEHLEEGDIIEKYYPEEKDEKAR